jgi:nucleotide-binding universal stress UspA family protein
MWAGRPVVAAIAADDVARAPIQAGEWLRKRFGVKLHLLHASLSPEAALGAAEDRLRTAWQALADEPGQEPRIAAVSGSVPKAIIRYAEEVDAGVVLFGPNRRKGGVATTIGTTAERVLRAATVPCMVVPRWSGAPRRILIPVDRSRPARGALRLAARWFAADPNTTLRVIQVSAIAESEHLRSMLSEREVEEEFRAGCGDDCRLQLEHGVISWPTAAEGIQEEIARWQPHLTVLGTRGTSVAGRIAFGSVAGHVAQSIEHPLLLVPETHRHALVE